MEITNLNGNILINGDCVTEIEKFGSESMDLSIFSPPFADLYVYSDLLEDMGNNPDYSTYFTHFNYLMPNLHRIMKPGRIVAVHCMDLPIQKGKEGFIGLRDFSGHIIESFLNNGFIYHSRITVWKDPVVEMQRTKALGLLHKQLKKDSTMSRVGLPDYVLLFRKEGNNEIPVQQDMNVDLWQKLASPVWFDINQSKTLNTIKYEKDEKHICPLQLDVIEKIIQLYSNIGETVFTPFMGIGSEIYQAILMSRKGAGIELKPEYYNQAVSNAKVALSLINQNNLFAEVS